mmetsp:Transcript_53506/g.153592  ORF Transcript_53506/g.153592 Transcript_53506/m.153592 type:complete len:106 (+) Transcript_53506:79-396(+)
MPRLAVALRRFACEGVIPKRTTTSWVICFMPSAFAGFTTTEHFVQLGGFAGMPEVMGSMTRSWQWVKPEQAGEEFNLFRMMLAASDPLAKEILEDRLYVSRGGDR